MDQKPLKIPHTPALEATFLKSASAMKDLPLDGKPEHCFIGRSNVGKSSLLNTLIGRKDLARVSSRPGKTQTLNYFEVQQGFYLVDVPGLGYAKTPKGLRLDWAKLIERYLNERETLQTVFHLIDARHPPMEVDHVVMDFIKGLPVLYVVVLTKWDKLTQKDKHQRMKDVHHALAEHRLEVQIVLTSSAKGLGRKELITILTN